MGLEFSPEGQRKRILICTNAYPPNFVGGAELMAHEQALALVRLGHDVRVFAGSPLFVAASADGRRHGRYDDTHEGIRVYRIGLEHEDYSPEYLNFLHPAVEEHFLDVLADFTPDIVHCHNLMGLSVKLPLLARQHGAVLVCTLHDFWGFCLRNTAMRSDASLCTDISECQKCLPKIHDGRELDIPLKARKDFIALALDQFDQFIAPSHYVARRYREAGFSQSRIDVIPNGIDLQRFGVQAHRSPPGSDQPLRITFVGHFGAHKGVSTLIEALGLTSGTILQLAGEGPEREAYAALVEALGLTDRVYFFGKVAPLDMPELYANSDMVVLPSIWPENQPVCLMESMAAKLPVIASRQGGIPELVEDGVNGLLFTSGNPHDLAAQISRMIRDPVFRQTAGLAGYRRVENLDHDQAALRLVGLYERLLKPVQGALRGRDLVCTRDINVITGLERRKAKKVGKALAGPASQARYCIVPSWLSGCKIPIHGVVAIGWPWAMVGALRGLIQGDQSLPLPAWMGQFLVRRGAKRQAVVRLERIP